MIISLPMCREQRLMQLYRMVYEEQAIYPVGWLVGLLVAIKGSSSRARWRRNQRAGTPRPYLQVVDAGPT
jgi:hypothetical protein